MTTQTKFIIACNARSGSTWLETMLSELPDATVDVELVWKPLNPDLAIIQPIVDATFSCSKFLSSLSNDSTIVGSKLLMEQLAHTPEDYANLRRTIDPEIRLIHLRRNYADVFYSLQRGMYKQASGKSENSNSLLHRDMQDRKADTSQYLARMDDLATEHRWKTIRRLNDLPRIARIRARYLWASFRAFLRGSRHQEFWGGRRNVSPRECEETLQRLLENDRWIATLKDGREHFMTIDYDEINTRFSDVARFLGASATDAQLAEIVANPPTVKLPSIPMDAFFDDSADLLKLCNAYDARKNESLSHS